MYTNSSDNQLDSDFTFVLLDFESLLMNPG